MTCKRTRTSHLKSSSNSLYLLYESVKQPRSQLENYSLLYTSNVNLNEGNTRSIYYYIIASYFDCP